MKEMEKAYNPSDHEQNIYALWESSGAFTPEIIPNKKPFVISMPPPNVTGILHIGHALFITLQDIMIRYHRMNGEPTLWLPGTDHAGIATQGVVEKMLSKKGIKKQDLGREKFVEEAWKWKRQYGDTITSQLRRVGASCDWSRERFTLDEGLSKAVNETFVTLYNRGLIYRGLRTVNWCPKCHSAISDDEVDHKHELGKLYWIKYGPFVIATSRPETKLGDTAVAVHPSDKRYKDMVGKKYMIPGVLGEFEVEVVSDIIVDPKFGTGAVKVTPGHSLTDYEISVRHNLPIKQIIDENGRMMENCGKYAGMKTLQAREAIVTDMQEMGLIDHIDENYDHNIGVCYRCGGIVEPIPSKQWFVKMSPLAQKAKEVVESGEIEIIPKRFEKVYFHWMNNIRDWCISRQLWWGHQIPVWYKDGDENKMYVGVTPPKGDEWIQDEDVLDTWFSSGIWPFSTLNWPDTENSDYKYFFPTTVMETGYDILFFWVARMIMMSIELTGKPPFKTVYLHGLVRDEHNRKFSKSLGNGIDPIDMSEKFGTDALRMSLIVGSTPGNDVALGESKIKGYRNFANKIWNIARFIVMSLDDYDFIPDSETELAHQDLQDIKKFNSIIKSVSKDIDNYKFSRAGETAYEYTWHEFADKIIENSKIRLTEGEPKDREATLAKLVYILINLLKIIHPFMPFVTEAIWQELPSKIKDSKLLISAEWPKQ